VFAHAKPGLAIGGGVAVTGSNATQTQVAINLLNAAAGNVGKTVRFGPDSAYGKVTPHAEVAALARAMAGGEIEVLVLGPGVDPVFTLPSGLKFADALRKVALVVSFAHLPDQTTELAHVSLPDTHWLESWGDYAPRKLEGDAGGLTLLAYPSLRFYDGRSAVSSWLQEAPDGITQAVWDAWVEVPEETAKKLGVAQGDMLAVKSPHGGLELPAYISPTLHPGTVAIPLGHRYSPYQRPRYVAADRRSLNPMALLPATADATSGGLAFMAVKVTLTKLVTRRPLAVLLAVHVLACPDQ